MTDARCDKCSFWGVPHEDFPEDVDDQVLEVKRCGKPIQLWDATEWDSNGDRVRSKQYEGHKMFVADGSSYRADLYTAPDFFCAHFQGKEQA